MKQPLAKFINSNRRVIAQLKDLKSIMRVDTRRTVSFWLVLPARGYEDCTCVLIRRIQEHWLSSETKRIQESILRDYSDRIINA